MPRKKPKIKMVRPQNNQQFRLGTPITIEVTISETNVPDDAVALYFTDVALAEKPSYELRYRHVTDKNVTSVSFPHTPARRGEHTLRCLGWFKYRGTNMNSPNSPSHNDKNVADDGVKITIT